MNCPRCLRPLTVRQHELARIDSCDGCGGMFLHRGELNRFAGPVAGDLEFSTIHGDSFRHPDAFGPANCPACPGESMKKVEFNIYTGIILDYCERCGGFWLDGHELDRIHDEVRRLNATQTDSPEPPMLWFARFIWSLPR